MVLVLGNPVKSDDGSVQWTFIVSDAGRKKGDFIDSAAYSQNGVLFRWEVVHKEATKFQHVYSEER